MLLINIYDLQEYAGLNEAPKASTSFSGYEQNTQTYSETVSSTEFLNDAYKFSMDDFSDTETSARTKGISRSEVYSSSSKESFASSSGIKIKRKKYSKTVYDLEEPGCSRSNKNKSVHPEMYDYGIDSDDSEDSDDYLEQAAIRGKIV